MIRRDSIAIRLANWNLIHILNPEIIGNETCKIFCVPHANKHEWQLIQKINVNEFLTDLVHKERIYNGIGMKAVEYQKISASNEDAILLFLNKQIKKVEGVPHSI